MNRLKKLLSLSGSLALLVSWNSSVNTSKDNLTDRFSSKERSDLLQEPSFGQDFLNNSLLTSNLFAEQIQVQSHEEIDNLDFSNFSGDSFLVAGPDGPVGPNIF